MSIPKMISGLQKSTKITIIACACFLAMTALILGFLMLFPIEPREQITMQNPVQSTAQPEPDVQTESAPEEEWRNTEAPHTLSTWSASIEGHVDSPNEYWEYLRSTTTYDTVFTEQPEFFETSEGQFSETTMDSDWNVQTDTQTETSFDPESGYSEQQSGEYTHTETQTETVVIPPETDPVPPETDPPVPSDPVLVPGEEI